MREWFVTNNLAPIHRRNAARSRLAAMQGVGTYPSPQRRSLAATASQLAAMQGVGTYPSPQRRSLAATASQLAAMQGVGVVKKMQLGGIHHVTAVTGNASRNVAFYTQVLGMRLTKKTVNQDDVSAYHLFYGDELGRPGTDLTFFEWADIGYQRPGAGTISTISLGVSGRDALDWWLKRFEDLNVSHDDIQTRGTDNLLVLPFRDPEGQRLELVDDAGKLVSTPWRRSPVPVEMAIHGFYAVRLTLRALELSARFLTEVLGFRRGGTYSTPHETTVTIFEVGPGGAGTEVHVEIDPQAPFHRFVGIGGVHHVAFRTPDYEEHQQWRERVARVNPTVTPVIDRFYFRSIYFREPGGVLFEIATDEPGFAIDEDVATLGERLSLPPFLEPQRQVIEAHLKPITPVDLTTRV